MPAPSFQTFWRILLLLCVFLCSFAVGYVLMDGNVTLTADLFAQNCEGPDRPLLRCPPRNIRLLQPLGSRTELAPSSGVAIVFEYFNDAWPWIIGVASGFAVMQAIWGGLKVMRSGGDSGVRESGKDHIQWALIGLIMIALAGFILSTLNDLFFVRS